MSALGRIFKNLGAAVSGRLIGVVPQVVLPPVFAHFYSLSSFGQWSVLSSAVGAVGLLNFGVQTYMSQDLALRYTRGELDGFHVRQSTALRVIGGMVLGGALLGLIVFLLPVRSLLKLEMGSVAAQLTLYLMGLQLLMNIIFGYLTGIYLGVQQAHRGAHLSNFRTLLVAVLLLAGVCLRLSFPVLAALQLVAIAVMMGIVLIDLKRVAPMLFPTVAHWDGKVAREILAPSGHFGLIMMSTFLTYQAPLVILQRAVGPLAVAAFIVMRTLFSMCRQVLATFTQSMSTEVTTLFGRRDRQGLMKLYDYSERFIFFAIPVANGALLMLSPVMLTLWMHKSGQLFSTYPYVLSAAVSMVISLKEHKYQFQFSSNTHEELARLMFFSYIGMFAVSIAAVHYFGVVGFLWAWLATEMFQMERIAEMNVRLFADVGKLEFHYLSRLAGICIATLAGASLLLPHTSTFKMPMQAAIAGIIGLVLVAVSWWMFGVRDVIGYTVGRVRKRVA